MLLSVDTFKRFVGGHELFIVPQAPGKQVLMAGHTVHNLLLSRYLGHLIMEVTFKRRVVNENNKKEQKRKYKRNP